MRVRGARARDEQLQKALDMVLAPDQEDTGDSTAEEASLRRIRALRDPVAQDLFHEAREAFVLGPKERQLRWVLQAAAVLYAVETVASLVLLGNASPGVSAVSVLAASKAIVLGAICLLVASEVRRFARLLTIVALSEALTAILLATAWAIHGAGSILPTGLGLSSAWFVPAWCAFSAGLCVALVRIRSSVARATQGLLRLAPSESETLAAVAEVTLPSEVLKPDDVARNVDLFLSSVRSPLVARIVRSVQLMAVLPILRLQPPLALMRAASRRRFLERTLATEPDRREPRRARLVRIVVQLAKFGDYSDRRVLLAMFGAVTPSLERPKTAPTLPVPALKTVTPRSLSHGGLVADVAIVGSGTAGSVLAERLGAAGWRVVVLERRAHVSHAEATDEAGQYATLYQDGGLSLVHDFEVRPLAAQCVGGGMMLSRGRMVRPPMSSLDRLESVLDLSAIEPSITRVETLVKSKASSEWADASTDGMRQALERLGLRAEPMPSQADQEVLRSLLAQAQRAHDIVIAERCGVEGIEHDEGRAVAVHCRVASGQRLRVRTERVVVAAGALNSARLLRRSNVSRHAGEWEPGFVVHPQMLGDFPEPRDAAQAAGTALRLASRERSFVVEVGLEPILTQALLMPGWFEQHEYNMRRYRHLVGLAVVAGIAVPDLRKGGPQRARLLEMLRIVGEVLLAAGAERVIAPTRRYREFRSVGQLTELADLLWQPGELSLGKAYPLGGIPFGPGPNGVVGQDYRVQGFKNLYVCDTSVLPSNLQVDPQLTVMAIANHLADLLLQR
jgi:choline dehydrogenase-like flavoprotein